MGTSWKNLLKFLGKNDEILLFYTEYSSGISYQDFQYILQYHNSLKYIKCNNGHNALDFQLVSYMGYLMKTGIKTEYIIVSKDKGFDSILDFWKERGRNVSRISPMDIHQREIECIQLTDKQEVLAEQLIPLKDETKIQWISKMLINYNSNDLQEIHSELVTKYGQTEGSEYYRYIKQNIKTQERSINDYGI